MASITIINTKKLDCRVGYDVTVEMVADGGRNQNKTFFVPGAAEPTQSSLQNKLDKFIADYNIPEGAMETYTEKEINKILKKKKYFTGNDRFPDDLPDKTLSIEVSNG